MTDARDEIFARIRAALKPLEARTTLPTFDASVAIARHAHLTATSVSGLCIVLATGLSFGWARAARCPTRASIRR